MKKIYVCIGVDGSGKTTYVEKQLNRLLYKAVK